MGNLKIISSINIGVQGEREIPSLSSEGFLGVNLKRQIK
jgi:hypothetical protein